MEAETVLSLRPRLMKFLERFKDCFASSPTRSLFSTYIAGQLSSLPRKSVEPMAIQAGVAPRTLQQLMSLAKWDEDRVRDELQRHVAKSYPHEEAVAIVDETSFVKKGRHTACVQRQHCGAAGKTENCVVSVHLGYAAGDFHTLLDGELYLPQWTWDNDRARCRKAGIPDDVVYRPKWQMALEQVRRALGNGVRFEWLTFDEGYGGKPPFLRAVDELGQHYVGEIPRSFVGWTVEPQVLYREHARDKRGGRPRKLPRLKVRNTPPATVQEILRHSPILRRVPWKAYYVQDGEKGPMVWKAKSLPFWIKDENGLPSRPHRLIITRKALDPEEVKFFLSNAPEPVPLETLLLVAFSRWRIERLFEDGKTELGLDHFEVRHFRSISRHLIITCISHLFLAEYRKLHRGEKSGPDRRPVADCDAPAGLPVEYRRSMLAAAGGNARRAIDVNAGTQRRGQSLAPQKNHPAFTRHRRHTQKPAQVQVVQKVAL
jgi:SRSO17 transposase